MEEKGFKSSYVLRLLKGDWNPFTPNVVRVNNEFIERRRRNWYLISVDTETYHFQNITGVFVDKHLIGATIRIMTAGNNSYIYIEGFSKKQADALKELCKKYISKNTQRSAVDAMADSITSAIGNHKSESAASSKARELKELKELLEQGVLTQEEFVAQKNKILNN
ncbi:SHOCT domain-containing protein [uncultured Alistipes sp.]|jgi:hypothetical protein|uniref:SHOCT domain-containing protein n=1 Tax=Alistipes sp. TaxID=1872444 RepID=UPI00266D754B|nr:SHOCT domain-containing protein [uncultured Alistipes sp.]